MTRLRLESKPNKIYGHVKLWFVSTLIILEFRGHTMVEFNGVHWELRWIEMRCIVWGWGFNKIGCSDQRVGFQTTMTFLWKCQLPSPEDLSSFLSSIMLIWLWKFWKLISCATRKSRKIKLKPVKKKISSQMNPKAKKSVGSLVWIKIF